MEHYCIRKIKMYPDEWQRLDQIAVDTGSHTRHGPTNLQATWQTLIRRIARGELVVTEPNPYKLPAGLAEAAAAVEQRQREQERIAEQERLERQKFFEELERRRRIDDHAKQVRKEPVKLEQIRMELEPA